MCDPNKLVGLTLSECPELADFYAEKMASHPCSEQQPWSIAILFDELTPGSLAHPQHGRKTLSVAFNFLELGATALSLTQTWFVPVQVRSVNVNDAIGGMSACMAIFLRVLFLGDLNIQTVGVTFRARGRVYTLFARLTSFCGDGEGIQLALDVFGHGGLRPCFRCQNVLRKNSNLAHRRPNFVDITCSDRTKLIASTTADLNAEVDEVMAAHAGMMAETMSWSAFCAIEQAYGIHANPTGILACLLLRQRFSIIDVVNEDWMHGALQEGFLNIACKGVLAIVDDRLDLPADALESFMKADWRFPSYSRNKMRSCWKIAANLKSEFHVKCMASELLGFYVLLRHFVFTIVLPRASAVGVELGEHLNAFQESCKVVDLIMLLKKGHADSNHRRVLLERLRNAVDRMIAAQKRATGTEDIRPKHHRMTHIANQIENVGFVVDAFIIERLHLLAKEVLGMTHNDTAFEASLLKACCMKQIAQLKQTVLTGLIGRTTPLRGFPGAVVAQRLRYSGMDVSVGDIVVRDSVVARVAACAAEGSHTYVIAEVWQEVSIVDPHSRRWRLSGDTQPWPAEEIEQAIAWYFIEGDMVVIV